MKANVRTAQIAKRFDHVDNGLCGEKFGVNMKDTSTGAQLWKSLRTHNYGRKSLTPVFGFHVFESLVFGHPKADAKTVASVILGGGAGTRLFPLTSRQAKPAVLAATQTPGEAGTADAVRQFIWVFEDAKNKNVENILILFGDHLYRMGYRDFVQKHIDTNANITVSCVPMDNSRASDYGLMKIDDTEGIIHYAEKPKGPLLKAMQVDTSVLGLSAQDAAKYPYIASMRVYVFNTDILLKLLKWNYPSCNDFGSEIIPSVVKD